MAALVEQCGPGPGCAAAALEACDASFRSFLSRTLPEEWAVCLGYSATFLSSQVVQRGIQLTECAGWFGRPQVRGLLCSNAVAIVQRLGCCAAGAFLALKAQARALDARDPLGDLQLSMMASAGKRRVTLQGLRRP